MRRIVLTLVCALAAVSLSAQTYQPTAENLKSRQEFAEDRFGIFIHWGIYSIFAQGEWYLQNAHGINRDEYAKAADAFYPHRFSAEEWVSAIKASGAKYICITTRHHDSFSMWDTEASPFNIVDATPFGRDILKELADECQKQGIALHLYYSHADWSRDDYPRGRTGWGVSGRDRTQISWEHYYNFMNQQITELLTNYGPIRAIWFDGWWDHDEDATPFDWQLDEQYAMVHNLQPSCLVANNHHQVPFEGEDIQIFERDLPGEMTTGFAKSVAEVSRLPLETCETMNGMWGYKIEDQNYKSTKTLIQLLVRAAGKSANLLMNIGPQPNGELPAVAVQRMKEMGEWMQQYGETIYGTRGGDVAPHAWGVSTRKGNRLFIHVLDLKDNSLYIPLKAKVKKAVQFVDGKAVSFSQDKDGVLLKFTEVPTDIDYVVELQLK